ncbi:MAG: hypothetical protein U0L85_04750 [Bacilli bacterium]|nr:hypothetical protein [Bacilli bacterium]
MEKECIEEILKGINMGILGIEHVEDKIQDKGLIKAVLKQKKEYESLKKRILKKYPQIEDKKGNFMAETMLEMKTMFADDSDIVKMLMQGCNMAVISMTEVIHKLDVVDMELRTIANDLEDVSKRYEEELKRYL